MFKKQKKYTSKDLKKYGLGDTRITLFKKKFGLNHRIKKVNFKRKLKPYFQKMNSRLLLNRKLFENVKLNIISLITLKSYKGLRHKNYYPVRGQRTHTNATKKVFKRKKFSR